MYNSGRKKQHTTLNFTPILQSAHWNRPERLEAAVNQRKSIKLNRLLCAGDTHEGLLKAPDILQPRTKNEPCLM